MQEAHLPILDEYLISGDVQIENGLQDGRRLLALAAPPTAIMASNNKLLLGVLQAVNEKGISIPDDLSVLGFDDYSWNQHFSPTLTAVAQLTHEIGRRSFELLMQLILCSSERIPSPTRLFLPAELRIRNSTGAPRKQDFR